MRQPEEYIRPRAIPEMSFTKHAFRDHSSSNPRILSAQVLAGCWNERILIVSVESCTRQELDSGTQIARGGEAPRNGDMGFAAVAWIRDTIRPL